MCNRHSFIVTKAGKIHHGLGVTDSHTTIREISGLGANDSSSYAFEWQPPKGWPAADVLDGLTKDAEPVPVWDLKKKHTLAIVNHIKSLYPDMNTWEQADAIIPLPDGLTVGGALDLRGCTGLTALPDGLTVVGFLNLSGCTGLTALPDGLTVGGSLDLRGCTGLTALPEGLTVGGGLFFRGCTGLKADANYFSLAAARAAVGEISS